MGKDVSWTKRYVIMLSVHYLCIPTFPYIINVPCDIKVWQNARSTFSRSFYKGYLSLSYENGFIMMQNMTSAFVKSTQVSSVNNK